MNFSMPWTSKPPRNAWEAPIEDIKHEIGHQLDHLAQVSAQVAREAATQAAHTTSDVSNQAVAVAREVPPTAVAVAQYAQQAMRNAAEIGTQLGRELRAVRITRQPAQPQGPDMMPGIALLGGLGGGLALMYFFDPHAGRRRRTLLREQINKWTRIGRDTAAGTAKDVANRTVDTVHEAQKAVQNLAGTERQTEAIASNGREMSQQVASEIY